MGVILATDPINGVKTAVADAVEAAEAPEPAIQLPLLPSDQLDLLPLDRGARQAALQAPRRAGRPPGAINRSTKAWREHFLTRYGSPMMGLGETVNRTPHDLALELGCSVADAFKLQQDARLGLMPYLHGKMPLEVELNGAGLVQLVINTGFAGDAGPVACGDLVIQGTILDNQQVSGNDDEKV